MTVEISKLLSLHYPSLKLDVKNGRYLISGEIDIFTEYFFLDCFDIKMEWAIDSPYPFLRFPKMYELSGKIPTNIDFHKYSDSSLCLCTPLDELLICQKGITIGFFIENIVKKHLIAQFYRRSNPNYPIGEYAHGAKGIIQSFTGHLEIENIEGIKTALYYLITWKNDRLNDECYCGSKKVLKKCHFESFQKLLPIDKHFLIFNLNKLIIYDKIFTR